MILKGKPFEVVKIDKRVIKFDKDGLLETNDRDVFQALYLNYDKMMRKEEEVYRAKKLNKPVEKKKSKKVDDGDNNTSRI